MRSDKGGERTSEGEEPEQSVSERGRKARDKGGPGNALKAGASYESSFRRGWWASLGGVKRGAKRRLGGDPSDVGLKGLFRVAAAGRQRGDCVCE